MNNRRENGSRPGMPARSLLALSILPMALAGATVANAQADTSPRVTQLEEVVVTASRRAQTLQSVPASIEAVTGVELDNRGITNFSDLDTTVSGLFLAQGSNLTDSALRIRGVGTRGNSANDPSVGVVVDGIYQRRPGSVFTEMLDIDRVEVLRGPQGTNFGKNTTSGVIAIHTAAPDVHEFSGRLQGVVGNLDAREARGVVNIPLVEGTLAARLSGYTAKRDGYTKNVFLNEDTRDMDRQGARLKVLWNATDNLSVTLTGEYQQQEAVLDRAIVDYGVVRVGPGPEVTYPEAFAQLNAGEPPTPSLGRAFQNYSDSSEDTMKRFIMNVNWDLGHHTLTSITGIEKFETSYDYDRDSSILPLSTLTTAPENDLITQEFQLTSNIDGPLSYIVGAFYQNEEIFSPTSINGNLVNVTERDESSYALFGNLTYDFSDRWTGVVGLRWSEDEAVNLGFERTFREITYTAKLLYHIDADKMVYFTHDKGYKSGGINRAVPGGDESLRFWEPEVAYNYEIGLNSQWWDNRLRLNAALFHQVFEDYQVTTSIMVGDISNVLITNAAEAFTQGLEFDFTAMVTDNLTLDGSAAWIRTEYDEYENAPCPKPPGPSCVDGAQDLSGKQMDNAPRTTFSLGAEYRDAVRDTPIEWFARADASYRSTAKLDTFLTDASTQDSYTLWNARFGFEAPGDWRLTLWGRNLTDKAYAFMGDRNDDGLQMIKGLPRTFGLTADWYF